MPTTFLFLLAFLFSMSQASSQRNVSGKNGLIYIPDATIKPSGTWSIGINYLPKQGNFYTKSNLNEQIVYTSLEFVKRLEITFLLLQSSRFDGIKNRDGIGDRQIDFRYQLVSELKNRPEVAIILSSPFSISNAIQTNAIVATKKLEGRIFNLSTTLGIGSPYYIFRDETNLNNNNIFSMFAFKKKSEDPYKNNYLVGLFGGVNFKFKNKLSLMAEWDSNKLNLGLHAKLLKKLNAQASLIGMKNLSFGIYLEQSLY